VVFDFRLTIEKQVAMWNSESKRPKYRLQPDHFLIGILAAQGGLLVADRFYLCGLTRGDLWNVQLAAGLVGGVVSVGLLWLFAGLLLRRSPQFGLRCLLLLTVAAAIPSGWYALWIKNGGRQEQALADVREIQTRICSGKPHRQIRYGHEALTTRPGVRQSVVGISFAVEEDLGCGCCYGDARSDVSDDDLNRLACLYELERLEVPDAKITDAGLARLRGLKNLRELDLRGNPITDAGLRHLRGLTNLQRLDLSQTEITDAGFMHLAALKNLQQLDFGSTRATGTGMKHLAGLSAFKQCGDSRFGGALLSVPGVGTFNDLQHLEELHGRIVQLALPGLANDAVELEGLAKLRIIDLENSLELKQVRFANLPALETVQIRAGPCVHCVSYGVPKAPPKPMTCTECSREVQTLLLENLPKLQTLTIENIHRLVLRNTPSLTRVHIVGIAEKEHLRELGQVAALQSLGVNVKRFSSPEDLFELRRLPHLEQLAITGSGLNDASLAVLESFPALKHLSLPAADFSGQGLANLRHLKELEDLSIGRFRDAGEPLAGLAGLSRLRSLHVSYAEIGTLRLVGLPNLERISIRGGRIGALELEDLPNAEWLRLENETSVRRLSVKDLPKLRSLSFRSSEAKMPLEHVALEQLPSLMTIRLPGDFRKPLLTDECLEHVDTFINLADLDVKNSRVTDRTIERLMQLPCLKSVDLYNTHTTEAAANRLREEGPVGIRVNQSGPR